jgi:Flp pilus assembly protein TadD
VVQIEDRIAECRRRWEASPGSRAFIPLADVLRQAGRCDEALSVLETGLSAHPAAVGALVTLARTLAAMGRTERAVATATRVLEQDPDNLVALEMLGEDERRRGEVEAAIVHFERLVQLEPGDRHWGGILASLREEREAAATAGGDGPGFATLTLVDLYLAQGYRQKATSLLRRLVADRPDDSALAERLSRLEEGDGPEVPLETPAGGMMPEAAAPARTPVPPVPGTAERREQSRAQFEMWIERLRAERGAAR